MRVIDQLIERYSNRGNAPLSVRECAQLHGIRWIDDRQQMAEFHEKFAICKDGIIRTR
jgi:sulfite reductase beta subunit-like hemoprotein